MSLSIACQTNGTSRVSSLDRFARKSRFHPFDSFDRSNRVRSFTRINEISSRISSSEVNRDLTLFPKFDKERLIVRS